MYFYRLSVNKSCSIKTLIQCESCKQVVAQAYMGLQQGRPKAPRRRKLCHGNPRGEK